MSQEIENFCTPTFENVKNFTFRRGIMQWIENFKAIQTSI